MRQAVELTREQARRFVLRRLGLAGGYRFAGKQGVLEYIRHVHSVQVDPVDVCGKSHQITLLSRVKGFEKPMLDRVLYQSRNAFEYYDKCLCILPVEEWPAFAAVRAHYRANTHINGALESLGPAARAALAAGPRTPAGLGIEGHIAEWPAWTNNGKKAANAVLDALYYTGEAVIHHREGAARSFALAADLLPGQHLAPGPFGADMAAWQRWQVKRRIAACGLLGAGASDAWLGILGFTATARAACFAALLEAGELVPLRVEGFGAPLYCLAEDLPLLEEIRAGAKYRARCELIAPLDSFIWDRRLIKALFGFAYKWEIYTPAEKRHYGHYVLPILWGERFAGRIELVKSPDGNTLAVRGIWLEKGVRRSKRLDSALTHCLARFARFNGCEGVVGYETAFR